MEEKDKRFYNLSNPIKVYCPVMNAQLHLGCELLDDMSEFTRYILYMIGNNYSITEIKDIIELGDIVIYEELNYMVQIKLCVLCEEQYHLTELGEKYYEILCLLDKINSNETKVQINCFTGSVMDYDDECIDEDKCNEDIYKLRVKIVKELFQNKNPSNAKEYLISKFNHVISEILSEEEVDNLYVNVLYEHGSLYKSIYIDAVQSIEAKNEHIEPEKYDMLLEHELITFKLKFQDSRLEKYRNVLPTLKNLKIFESALLSKISLDLLEIETEEQLLNKNSEIFYFDSLTGEIFKDFIHTDKDNSISIITPQKENKRILKIQNIMDLVNNNQIEIPEHINIEFVSEESVYSYEKTNLSYFI